MILSFVSMNGVFLKVVSNLNPYFQLLQMGKHKFLLYNVLGWGTYALLGVILYSRSDTPLYDSLLFFLWRAIAFYSAFYGYRTFLSKRRYIAYGLFFVLTYAACWGINWFDDYVLYAIFNPDIPLGTTDYRDVSLAVLLQVLQHAVAGTAFAVIRNKQENAEQSARLAQVLLHKEKELKKIEFSFLHSQANQHFLFNTFSHLHTLSYKIAKHFRQDITRISALQASIVRSDAQMLTENIMILSQIMRYSIVEQEKVSLAEEIRQLENYIKLFRSRSECHVTFTRDEEDNMADMRILPLTLISLVENAFKHGDLSEPEDPLQITLETRDSIRFTVRNKKRDILSRVSNQPVSTLTGSENIKKRLNLIYPGQFRLAIDESVSHYACELVIFG